MNRFFLSKLMIEVTLSSLKHRNYELHNIISSLIVVLEIYEMLKDFLPRRKHIILSLSHLQGFFLTQCTWHYTESLVGKDGKRVTLFCRT